LETALVSRLRSNTAEFATLIRCSVGDFNAAAITNQGYSFFLNYPSYYRVPAGTITQMSAPTLLANEQKVFDEYKVVKLVVKYMPWVTSQVRVNTAVAFTAPSDPLLIMTVDYDDSAIFTSSTKALNAQNAALHNCYEPTLKVCSMKQMDPVDKQKWLNLGAIIPNATTPPDVNNPAKLASIKLWKDAYQLANTVEGSIFAEWTVIFKGIYSLA